VARMPATDGVQLVIAGSGEERAALEALATDLGVADRVRFIGRVEGQEKVYLLQNALLTVMPSRTWEAFPLVVLESYAAGKPIVGTAIAGIVDLVEEGKTGMLVPEEDPAGLARAMGELFEHPNCARSLGELAVTIARQNSWDFIAARHIELYEELRALRGTGYQPVSRDEP
jgi:glycosyltransferase involved in cell wall biosynthesis